MRKNPQIFKFQTWLRMITLHKTIRIFKFKKSSRLLKFRKYPIDQQCKKKEEAFFKKLT
jgi:hypothetical protein